MRFPIKGWPEKFFPNSLMVADASRLIQLMSDGKELDAYHADSRMALPGDTVRSWKISAVHLFQESQ